MVAHDGDALMQQLERQGYCVMRDVVPADRCGPIRQSVAATVARERHRYPTAPPNVGFTPGLINHDQTFVEYLADAGLLGLLGRLLGQHIRISFTSAIINEPGNERGGWHADWPFNQNNAGHIPVPYPDVVMHVTTLWMLSPFEAGNGGTLVLPGSHRYGTNPTAVGCAVPEVGGTRGSIHPHDKLPGERNITGTAGSVLVMDSRLWHATSRNESPEPRVALAVRYAPWWLNLEVLRPESDVRRQLCEESGQTDNVVPSLQRSVFHRLPPRVQPLLRHWVGD